MSADARSRSATSLFGAVGLLMSGRTVGFLATLCTPILLARLFSNDEFGSYKQLFLVFATLYPIAQIGMAESLFYFLPDAGDEAARYVANAVMLLGVAGVGSLAALLAASGGISRWLGNASLAADLPLIGAFTALMLTAAGLEIVMTASRRYRLAATTYGASDIVRGACIVAPALIFRRLDAVLVGAVIFAGLRLVAAGVYFHRTFRAGFRPDGALLVAQLKYGVPFGLAVLLEVAQANYHQYAVAHYFNAAAFAVYAVGCLQVPLVDFVATSTASVMMVHLARERQDGRTDRALDVWMDATRKLALLFFPIVAVLAVTGHDLIVLMFTGRYAGSVSVFHVALATIALSAFSIDAVLRAYAETRFLMGLYALKLLLVALLVGPCLHAFGLPGAILATVLTLGAAKAIALTRISRILCVRVREVLPWRALIDIAAVSVLAALAGFAARWAVGDAPLVISLAVSGLVTGGVSAALVLGAGVLSERERAMVIGWLSRVAGRVPAALGSDS